MDENNLVVKANKFIEAKGKMTMIEQRLIAGLVSEIRTEDSSFKEYELEVKQLQKDLNIGDTAFYSTLRDTTNEMMKKELVIEDITPSGRQRFIVTRIISSAEYMNGSGKLKITFAPVLKPYFLGLKRNFTEYQFKNILDIKSSHSIRIYELLKQMEKPRNRTFQVDDLKEILGINNEYRRFYDFEKRVLIVAKKEINRATDIEINYEKIKVGRKVDKIIFSICSKRKNDYQEEMIDMMYTKAEIEDIKIKSGLKNEKFNNAQIIQLYEIAVERTEDSNLNVYNYLIANYIYTLRKAPKNKFSYLKNALKENYANCIK